MESPNKGDTENEPTMKSNHRDQAAAAATGLNHHHGMQNKNVNSVFTTKTNDRGSPSRSPFQSDRQGPLRFNHEETLGHGRREYREEEEEEETGSNYQGSNDDDDSALVKGELYSVLSHKNGPIPRQGATSENKINNNNKLSNNPNKARRMAVRNSEREGPIHRQDFATRSIYESMARGHEKEKDGHDNNDELVEYPKATDDNAEEEEDDDDSGVVVLDGEFYNDLWLVDATATDEEKLQSSSLPDRRSGWSSSGPVGGRNKPPVRVERTSSTSPATDWQNRTKAHRDRNTSNEASNGKGGASTGTATTRDMLLLPLLHRQGQTTNLPSQPTTRTSTSRPALQKLQTKRSRGDYGVGDSDDDTDSSLDEGDDEEDDDDDDESVESVESNTLLFDALNQMIRRQNSVKSYKGTGDSEKGRVGEPAGTPTTNTTSTTSEPTTNDFDSLIMSHFQSAGQDPTLHVLSEYYDDDDDENEDNELLDNKHHDDDSVVVLDGEFDSDLLLDADNNESSLMSDGSTIRAVSPISKDNSGTAPAVVESSQSWTGEDPSRLRSSPSTGHNQTKVLPKTVEHQMDDIALGNYVSEDAVFLDADLYARAEELLNPDGSLSSSFLPGSNEATTTIAKPDWDTFLSALLTTPIMATNEGNGFSTNTFDKNLSMQDLMQAIEDQKQKRKNKSNDDDVFISSADYPPQPEVMDELHHQLLEQEKEFFNQSEDIRLSLADAERQAELQEKRRSARYRREQEEFARQLEEQLSNWEREIEQVVQTEADRRRRCTSCGCRLSDAEVEHYLEQRREYPNKPIERICQICYAEQDLLVRRRVVPPPSSLAKKIRPPSLRTSGTEKKAVVAAPLSQATARVSIVGGTYKGQHGWMVKRSAKKVTVKLDGSNKIVSLAASNVVITPSDKNNNNDDDKGDSSNEQRQSRDM